MERGKLPKVVKSEKSKDQPPGTKFKTLHRETLSLFSSPKIDQQSDRPMNISNYRTEPLSKYD